MRSALDADGTAREIASGEPRRRVDGRLVVLLVVVALGARGMLGGSLDPVALRTWTTVFVAIVVQALPFLALGVLISGAITALVSPAVLARLLPRATMLAVPSAALAGTALPGCECASVPIAGRLCARGVQPAAAVAFMLAAPAVNPVVLVATAVAFPGQPRMVLARLLARSPPPSWSGCSGRGSVTRRGCSGPATGWPATRGPAGRRSPRRPATTSGTPGAGWWWARPQPCRSWSPVAGASGGRPSSAVGAGHGRASRAAGHLLGSRRVRGRQPARVLAHGPAGLPGRRPGPRRQADRHAGRSVRPPVRGPLRPLTFVVAVACALAVAQAVLR